MTRARASVSERSINQRVVTIIGEKKMPYLIMENGDVQTESVRMSKCFSDYLKEMSITPTGNAYGFPNYRAASRLPKEEASSKLCDLAGDIMMVFDVDPTPVIPRGNSRLEFANQIGIFYIDDVVSK